MKDSPPSYRDDASALRRGVPKMWRTPPWVVRRTAPRRFQPPLGRVSIQPCLTVSSYPSDIGTKSRRAEDVEPCRPIHIPIMEGPRSLPRNQNVYGLARWLLFYAAVLLADAAMLVVIVDGG